MNQPNLGALLAVIVGIAAVVGLPFHPALWLLAGLGFWAVIGWRHWRYRQESGWLLLGGVVVLAAFIFSYGRASYWERVSYNQGFSGKRVTVAGQVTGRPEVTERGSRFELTLDRYRNLPRGKVTVYCLRPLPESWVGRRIQVSGRFKALPVQGRGWPDFYERRQLTGVVIAERDPLLGKARFLSPVALATQWRLKLAAVGRRSLSPLNGLVLQGMLFGDDLPEEGASGAVLEDFRRTGTIHLLSVSGLHVGFVVAGLTWLLGWCGIRRAGRIPFLLLGVGFYILMTGMEAPVLRSGLMLLLYVIAGLLQAKDDPLNRLGLAAVILLLLSPYNLFELGFQLSFAATAGVVGLFPTLKEYFPVKASWLKPVWHTLLLSMAAQLMVLPLLAIYFYQISWIAPLANLVIAIPSLVMVMGGLAGELLGLIFPALAHVVLVGVDWVVTLGLHLIRICSRLDWAVSWTPRWPWPWVVGYYLGLGLLVQGLRPNRLTERRDWNWGLVGLTVLGMLNLAVWTGVVLKNQAGSLEVAFIDVGQGDAILLRTPDRYTVLVDGGDEGRGRGRIVPYLRQQGVGRLDQVFGTHGDRDHLGGLDEVLLRVPAGTLYGPPETEVVTRKFLSRVKGVRVRRRVARNGMRLRWGKYVTARVFKVADAENDNDASTVLLVCYGKYQLLLTGDLGVEGERYLADRYPQLLQATVIKAGHHGSDASTNWNLLSQAKPKIAVISVGVGNRYGHPGKATLNRLHSLGTAVYRTDRQGTIRLRFYSDRILVIPEERDTEDEAG